MEVVNILSSFLFLGKRREVVNSVKLLVSNLLKNVGTSYFFKPAKKSGVQSLSQEDRTEDESNLILIFFLLEFLY